MKWNCFFIVKVRQAVDFLIQWCEGVEVVELKLKVNKSTLNSQTC